MPCRRAITLPPPDDADRPPIAVLVDGDACPVKAEVYRVAGRHGVRTVVVANSPILVPRDPLVERIVVSSGLDRADDEIAARCRASVVVVTADVPLADRAIKAGATVVAPDGRALTASSIGAALATRNLLAELREAGHVGGGPKPFTPRARSAFLQSLDLAIVRLKRAGFPVG